MKIFTFKQRLVSFVIGILDWIINSPYFVKPLNILSKLLKTIVMSNRFLQLNRFSIFQSLSVAFIADGNRLWLKNRISNGLFKPTDVEKNEENKVKIGTDKIVEVVKFAYYNKLSEVSFYCFAIKNFKRSKVEVDGIMNYVKKEGVFDNTVPFKFKLHGRLDLLQPDVREALLKIEDQTKDVNGLIFNLFFAYSSSDDENNEKRFSKKVNLLVRTSGEKRLSDFMVRQVANGTSVEFIKPLWPEFSIAHLWLVLFKYVLEEKYMKN
jgi:ditrans,polycis-polyprenyl diphosphate synthase